MSSDAVSSAPVAVLSPGQGSLALEPFAQLAEDKTGRLTVDSVDSAAHWQPLPASGFNPGFSHSSWWLRIGVHNPGSAPQTLLLDTDSALADYLDLMLVHADGQVQSSLTGDRRPFATRALENRTFALPFTLAPGERATLYLRQASHDGLQEVLRPRLWELNAFAPHLQRETLLFGLYFGTIAAIFLYNLFLFLSAPERNMGLYLLYVAGMFGWAFTFRGYSLQYLWPDSPDLNNQLLPLLAGVCYCAIGLFAQEYLQLRHMAPRWMLRAHQTLYILNALTMLPALFGHYSLAFALLLPVGSLALLQVNLFCIWLWRRGSRPAHFFLLSFTLQSIGILMYFLRMLGVLEPGLIVEYSMHIGSFLQVLLLALGVADQWNTLKAEKLKAEQQARAAEHTLNTQLAVEVRQRTEELQLANQRLSELAITDELTGAFNRRHFNQMFTTTYAGHRRLQTPFAFCMIDIDYFKSFNDLCGHKAGDDALRKVSQCLRSHLKRDTDALFRLGGEEFGILMCMDSPGRKAPPFVENLREAIEAMNLPHPGSKFGRVTASFGLLTAETDSTLSSADEVYSRADALLYQAKASGRNRLVHGRG
ncbi:MAG TPA: diguanylate cyclase [Dongiaceae bacterium]|nr:diguanylate cyclase [Dongiaceae bacterium]